MKRVICFVVFLAVILIVFPCSVSAEAASVLPPPENVRVGEQNERIILEWNEVAGNEGYLVEINGANIDVDKGVEKLDVTDYCPDVIPYAFRVCAKDGAGEFSEWSAAASLSKAVKLAKVSNFYVVDGVLRWDVVPDANGYSVVVNGIEVESELKVAELSLDKLFNVPSNYIIEVCAKGDGKNRLDGKYGKYEYADTEKLTTPENLSVAPSDDRVILSWMRVDFASGYKIKIDETEFSVARNRIFIDEYVKTVAAHDICVTAVGRDGYVDSDAATFVYNTVAKLEKPVPVIDEAARTVSWNEVPNAKSYSVAVNGVPCPNATELTDTSYNFSDSVNGGNVGGYNISVQANKNGNYSASDCAVVTYNKMQKLATPVGLSINGTEITWNAVADAESYSVIIDGRVKDAEVRGNSFDIAAYCAEVKDYNVEVCANAHGYYTKSDCARITYRKTSRHASPQLAVDGLVIKWNKVMTAKSYSVAVDGKIVSDNCVELLFDLSEYLTEEKWYKVSVTANADGNYDASAPSETEIIGAAKQSEYLTYTINGVDFDEHTLLFVDGVRWNETKIENNNTLRLPSTAKILHIVADADFISELNEVTYYEELDLERARSGGNLTLSPGFTTLTKEERTTSGDNSAFNTTRTFEKDNVTYAYHYIGTVTIPIYPNI